MTNPHTHHPPIMRRISFDSLNFSLLFIFLLVIISDQGGSHQKSGPGTSGTSSVTTRQRWLQYQTALSNTGPLGTDPSSSTTTVTIATVTTPPPGAMVMSTINPNSSLGSRPLVLSPTTNSSTSIGAISSKPLPGNATVGTGRLPPITTKPFGRGGSSSGGINSYNSNRNNYFGAGRRRIPTSYDGFPDGALFENNTSVNITVPLGDTAFLRCRVKNLGERSISWIRRRDWHILTTGKVTYTNDERFHLLHTEGTEDWTLQIKFVQKRDECSYECQISTGTGIISFLVHLMIAVPEAFILGNGDEYHVEQGSTINLVCVIEKSPKVPEFIFWYHNDRMINYGSSREVTVRTEPGLRTQSRLTIRDARISDSGNFTCKTSNAEPASIFVYVSQASGLFSGDKIAAIQRRTNVNNSPSATSSASSSSSSSMAMASMVQIQKSFSSFNFFSFVLTISAITITLQLQHCIQGMGLGMAVSIFAPRVNVC